MIPFAASCQDYAPNVGCFCWKTTRFASQDGYDRWNRVRSLFLLVRGEVPFFVLQTESKVSSKPITCASLYNAEMRLSKWPCDNFAIMNSHTRSFPRHFFSIPWKYVGQSHSEVKNPID